jgi:hypothetical protein
VKTGEIDSVKLYTLRLWVCKTVCRRQIRDGIHRDVFSFNSALMPRSPNVAPLCCSNGTGKTKQRWPLSVAEEPAAGADIVGMDDLPYGAGKMDFDVADRFAGCDALSVRWARSSTTRPDA